MLFSPNSQGGKDFPHHVFSWWGVPRRGECSYSSSHLLSSFLKAPLLNMVRPRKLVIFTSRNMLFLRRLWSFYCLKHNVLHVLLVCCSRHFVLHRSFLRAFEEIPADWMKPFKKPVVGLKLSSLMNAECIQNCRKSWTAPPILSTKHWKNSRAHSVAGCCYFL